MSPTPCNCPHCNAPLVAGAGFCHSCGRPMAAVATPIPATPIAQGGRPQEDVDPEDEEDDGPPSDDPSSRGEIGMKGALLFWLILWAAIAIGVGMAAGLEAVAGVGLAAVISLVLMWRQRAAAWRGRVIEVRSEQERVRRHKHWRTETRTYVYIQDDRGSIRKEPLMHEELRVGDLVEKRKGEATYHRA